MQNARREVSDEQAAPLELHNETSWQCRLAKGALGNILGVTSE
jgi:hypothetical protein